MAISVKATVLNTGRKLLLNAAAGFASFVPFKYVIGSQAQANITSDTTAVSGEVVFEGAAYLMEAKRIDESHVRYTMLIPESAGPFYIGNIVMYAVGQDQNPQPFVALNFPMPMLKRKSSIDELDNRPFPGQRLIISVTLKHAVLNDGEIQNLVVNVSNPEFATLPTYGNDFEVPDPHANPWSQFIIQHSYQSATPAFVSQVDTDQYWMMPLMRNLRHPFYGVVSGGMTGDKYMESIAPWIGGARLSIPSSQFTHTLGGRPLDAVGSGLNRIGGLPL